MKRQVGCGFTLQCAFDIVGEHLVGSGCCICVVLCLHFAWCSGFVVRGGGHRACQWLQAHSLISCRTLHVYRMCSSINGHGRVMGFWVGSVASSLATERKQCLLFAQHKLQMDWLPLCSVHSRRIGMVQCMGEIMKQARCLL